jgi:hypothetical protein
VRWERPGASLQPPAYGVGGEDEPADDAREAAGVIVGWRADKEQPLLIDRPAGDVAGAARGREPWVGLHREDQQLVAA